MSERIKASILVAVKGDRRIYRLLDSLEAQNFNKEHFEVIVVENGSCDFADVTGRGKLEIIYLHLETGNMAVARNAGLARARGAIILSTDADVVVPPTWVERMFTALELNQVGAIGGPIEKYRPTTLVQKYAITVVDGQSHLSFLPALHLPYVAGANCGYRTDAVRAAGGFDEELESGSDVDICYKLGLGGWRIGLAADATVYHEDREGLAAHFNRFRRYAIYQVLLFKKYKHISKRRYVLNAYPAKRLIGAIVMMPRALTRLIGGDISGIARAVLQVTESVGIWVGSIQGAIRYRQLYL